MRLLKFAIYAALTVTGIALSYHRVAAGVRDGAEGWAARAPSPDLTWTEPAGR